MFLPYLKNMPSHLVVTLAIVKLLDLCWSHLTIKKIFLDPPNKAPVCWILKSNLKLSANDNIGIKGLH